MRQILSSSWALYRKFFGLIAGLTVVAWLPSSLIDSYCSLHIYAEDEVWKSMLLSLGLDLIFAPVALGGIYVVLERHRAGAMPRFGASLARGCALWGRLFLARLIVTLGVVLGLALLVAPGVLVLVRSLLVVPLVVREPTTLLAPLQRSFALTRGHFWRLSGWFATVVAMLCGISLPILSLILLPAFAHWLAEAALTVLAQIIFAFLTVFTWVVMECLLHLPPPLPPLLHQEETGG